MSDHCCDGASDTVSSHSSSAEGRKGGYVVIFGKLKFIGSSLRKATSKEQNILFVQLTWEGHRSVCLFLSLNVPSGYCSLACCCYPSITLGSRTVRDCKCYCTMFGIVTQWYLTTIFDRVC